MFWLTLQAKTVLCCAAGTLYGEMAWLLFLAAKTTKRHKLSQVLLCKTQNKQQPIISLHCLYSLKSQPLFLTG
jgi:hypothetical protein